MSTRNLLKQSRSVDTVRQWLVAPSTVRMWAVSTAVWMTTVFAACLLAGMALGQPRNGVSAGIVVSGLCLVVTIDRMWRRLDRLGERGYNKD